MNNKDNMDIDVRAVQERELEILKTVMALCDRHGLRYWADGGTCLGTVRHKGFIPWDDDVDIGMPRADFDRFRDLAPRELPEHLVLQDFRQTRSSTHFFLKVHDKRTTFVETDHAPYEDLHTGVYIDIFPYDGYPAAKWKRGLLWGRAVVLRRINWALRKRYSGLTSLGDKLKFCLLYPLRLVLPFYWASDRMENMLRRYDQAAEPDNTESVFWAYFPTSCVKDTVMLPFEDIMIPCPAAYDEYLTLLYGDYMQPPPQAEQVPQHTVAWFSLDKSYLTHWWEEK